MMLNMSSTKSFCRLCLTNNDANINVFSKSGHDLNLLNKISNTFSFTINEFDSLPKCICRPCINQLETFVSFSKKVLEVQSKLQESEMHVQLPKHLQLVNIEKESDSSFNHTKTENISTVRNSRNKTLLIKSLPIKTIKKTAVIVDNVSNSDIDSDASLDFSNENLKEIDNDSDDDLPLCKRFGKITNFPDEIISDCKVVIKGKRLLKLLSKFFTLECLLCPEKTVFKWLPSMDTHFEVVHNMKSFVTCCGSKIVEKRSMTLHMARHIQPEAFTCHICNKVVTRPRTLKYHLQNHLPESERPLQCKYDGCPRRFSYISAKSAHEISHLPENERVAHICDECGKQYASSGQLSSHVSVAHTQHNPFICHICAKQLSSQTNLKYHLATHEPKVENQVQCYQCGKWSKNKVCLTKHMELHSGKIFRCKQCSYTSKSRQCFHSHVRNRHSKEKTHSCELCDKSFKLKQTLKAHMGQHTGLKRFKCQFCSREFTNSGNYYAHRKRMHAAELKAYNEEKVKKDTVERLQLLKNTSIGE